MVILFRADCSICLYSIERKNDRWASIHTRIQSLHHKLTVSGEERHLLVLRWAGFISFCASDRYGWRALCCWVLLSAVHSSLFMKVIYLERLERIPTDLIRRFIWISEFVWNTVVRVKVAQLLFRKLYASLNKILEKCQI